VLASVLIGVRQQRQEAGALDRYRELTLIERLRTRDAARNDLARLSDVALQRGQILIVDVLHALGSEAAELLTAGEAASTASATGATTATTVITAAAAATPIATAATAAVFNECHCRVPPRP
jgi:hypothetical protein